MARKSQAGAAAAEINVTDEVRKIADIKPDPRNLKRHSERQIADIALSIEEFGYVNKVAIRPDGQIIGGHATIEGLKRLGRDHVEVRMVSGLSEAAYQRLAIALNALPENSSWDERLLAEVLGELDEADEPLDRLGLSENRIKNLLAGDDEIEVKEVATSDVDDEFWISVRGPLKDQAHALKALNEAMKPFPEVSVDLGTIAVGAV